MSRPSSSKNKYGSPLFFPYNKQSQNHEPLPIYTNDGTRHEEGQMYATAQAQLKAGQQEQNMSRFVTKTLFEIDDSDSAPRNLPNVQRAIETDVWLPYRRVPRNLDLEKLLDELDADGSKPEDVRPTIKTPVVPASLKRPPTQDSQRSELSLRRGSSSEVERTRSTDDETPRSSRDSGSGTNDTLRDPNYGRRMRIRPDSGDIDNAVRPIRQNLRNDRAQLSPEQSATENSSSTPRANIETAKSGNHSVEKPHSAHPPRLGSLRSVSSPAKTRGLVKQRLRRPPSSYSVTYEEVEGITLSSKPRNKEMRQGIDLSIPEIEARDIRSILDLAHKDGGDHSRVESNPRRPRFAPPPPPVGSSSLLRSISPHPVVGSEERILIDRYSRAAADEMPEQRANAPRSQLQQIPETRSQSTLSVTLNDMLIEGEPSEDEDEAIPPNIARTAKSKGRSVSMSSRTQQAKQMLDSVMKNLTRPAPQKYSKKQSTELNDTPSFQATGDHEIQRPWTSPESPTSRSFLQDATDSETEQEDYRWTQREGARSLEASPVATSLKTRPDLLDIGGDTPRTSIFIGGHN